MNVKMNELTQFQTTHQAMGTVMMHRAFGEDAELCLAAICEEIDALEMLMSRFIPESEISRINEILRVGRAHTRESACIGCPYAIRRTFGTVSGAF